MTMRVATLVVLSMTLAACGSSRERTAVDAGPTFDAGSTVRDSGARLDGASTSDGGYGYCPGIVPTAEECRSDSECACGMCLVGPICGGVGCPAMCGTDADCKGGICTGGCCPACIPRCPTTACTEGTRCNTTSGRCDPIPCSEGMACPTNTRCTPDAPGSGCVRLTCTTDGECDCGTCAEGQCWDRPGRCCPPLPG